MAKAKEGYLLIDHRASPGLDAEFIQKINAQLPTPILPAMIGSTAFETGTATCSHCQRMVLLHIDRTRERAYCQKCDHYICDECGLAASQGVECLPWAKVIDTLHEEASKNLNIKVL